MNCMPRSFVVAPHNNIMEFECNMLKIVEQDVECELGLQPVTNRVGYHSTANHSDDARLDIFKKGSWPHGPNMFFNVRVTNVDKKHKLEKKTTL